MIRVLSRITTEPWAITREGLDTILDIAQRENLTPQTVAERLGRPLENSYAVEVRDGIAILPVTGPLFRYANLLTDLSGATSYDLLARDFRRAVDDRRVHAVVLTIDSPGGEANGVSEFADQIFAARGRKPIVAYVDGSGASAAYWIAAAADEVVVADTAQVGSIGAVMAVLDTRQREEKLGVRRVEIVSSQSPHKRLDPATDEGHRRLQARVDALSAVFIAKVAAYRGVPVATVVGNYGQGDVLVGADAVTAGLADRVGHFEDVIARLQAGSATSQTTTASEDDAMSDTPTPAPDNDARVREQHDAGVREGRTQERERIRSILGCEAATDRTELAHRLALDTDVEAVDAAVLLAASPKVVPDGFARLDALMRREGNAQVGADADPDVERDPGEELVNTARALGLAK
jgi:signal peptide peptidase SppA